MEAFINAVKEIVLAAINKITIVHILLALVIFGYFTDNRVFTWLSHIGQAFKGMLP